MKKLVFLAFLITSIVIGQSLPEGENVKSVGGIGLDGDGNYRLAGRRALNKEKITHYCDDTGIVAVYIEVDTSGNVLKAIPGFQGSTTSAKCLLWPSEQAALKTKFNADSNAPLKQSGIIFYKYKLSEKGSSLEETGVGVETTPYEIKTADGLEADSQDISKYLKKSKTEIRNDLRKEKELNSTKNNVLVYQINNLRHLFLFDDNNNCFSIYVYKNINQLINTKKELIVHYPNRSSDGMEFWNDTVQARIIDLREKGHISIVYGPNTRLD